MNEKIVLALSIQQPWAWLIVNGYKNVENRSWRASKVGYFYVHAGKKFDAEGYRWVREEFPNIEMPSPSELEYGGIVGFVDLTDCVHIDDNPHFHEANRWAFGPWCFLLADAAPLPFKPCRGQLGFFRTEFAHV